MNETTCAAIESTFEQSLRGRLHFSEVIARLVAVQVESYHVDYRAGRTTYYLPNGETLDLGFEQPVRIEDAFDGDAVHAAILAERQGRMMYGSLKQFTQQAGCVGYTVWIAGRHVAYFGRKGETQVERFPD